MVQKRKLISKKNNSIRKYRKVIVTLIMEKTSLTILRFSLENKIESDDLQKILDDIQTKRSFQC